MKLFLLACVMGTVFVNGFTDAVNGVSATIATGVYTEKKAIFLSGIYHFFGVLYFCMGPSAVGKTMGELAGLGGFSAHTKLLATSLALLSVMLFATAAWAFGIPTSESHALLGAVAGCAAALHKGRFSWGILGEVLMGQVFSVAFGFAASWWIGKRCKAYTKKGDVLLKGNMALLSILHAGQDGQKFFALLVGAAPFAGGDGGTQRLAMALAIALLMSAGTWFGGKRIIHKVKEMADLDKKGWLASDFATILGMGVSTVLGTPISTTYAKLSAIGGAACALQKRVNKSTAAQMLASWAVTFPTCFAIAYCLGKWLLHV